MPSFLDFRRTVAALVAVAMSAALIAFAFITSDSFKTWTAPAWSSPQAGNTCRRRFSTRSGPSTGSPRCGAPPGTSWTSTCPRSS